MVMQFPKINVHGKKKMMMMIMINQISTQNALELIYQSKLEPAGNKKDFSIPI
jgi:hypothetical protein